MAFWNVVNSMWMPLPVVPVAGLVDDILGNEADGFTGDRVAPLILVGLFNMLGA